MSHAVVSPFFSRVSRMENWVTGTLPSEAIA